MKTRVAVIFGGKSTEHEISIISAVQAMNNMDADKYEIIPLYLSKENEFYTGFRLRDINEYRDLKALISKSRRVICAKILSARLTLLFRLCTAPMLKTARCRDI